MIEVVAVLASPAVAFYLLRLRPMAPNDLPDPSMHTAYLLDPRDMLTRYAAAYASTGRLREGYRVGFLVPARVAAIVFGPVPGFFVTRYLFALVAVVPTYLLLRRLYGRAAGAIGAIVIMSCPVVLTAWGTDYPDSAVVSYAAGGLACLALSFVSRRRVVWVAAGGGLLVMAIWAHGMGLPIAAVTVAGFLFVELLNDRRRLVPDIGILAAVALLVTGALSLASRVWLLGFDFIGPTWRALSWSNRPGQIALNHSSNWRWAPYVSYILVPPAVAAAWAAVFVRRLRDVPSPQLLVGVVAVGQVAAFAYLQFGYHLQSLEMHFFSSTLWGATCLGLAVTIAHVARPLLEGRPTRWLPAGLLVAVPLVYEADPHVPAFGWLPVGLTLAVALAGFAVAARVLPRRVASVGFRRIVPAVAIVGISGCALVLTVAPVPRHPHLADTSRVDVRPAYGSALGGNGTPLVDRYRVTTELPSFVGNASYRGEELDIWWQWRNVGRLTEVAALYFHAGDMLPSSEPVLTAADRRYLAASKPAELLLVNTTEGDFAAAVTALGPYEPTILRRGVLRSGSYTAYVWLLRLGRFWRGP